MFCYIAFPVILALSLAQVPNPDLIQSLPGEPEVKNVDISQYSGYLEIGDGKHIHYWFLKGILPKPMPLVLFLSGGPGCSSFTSLFTETGPYRVSTTGNRLHNDPANSTWAKLGNILYLESPVGVGYSFTDPWEPQPHDYNDETIVNETIKALGAFYEKFAELELTSVPLFIFAEGYASTAGALLAQKLISNASSPKLGGLMIEGGFINDKYNENLFVDYAFYHGLISPKRWNSLHRDCCNGTTCSFYKPANGLCSEDIGRVRSATSLLNNYNIFSSCALPSNFSEDFGLTDWPCFSQESETLYLNRDDVREALHISSMAPKWTSCSENVSTHYRPSTSSLLPILKDLAATIHVALVTGDGDMKFHFLGTRKAVESLRLRMSVAWRPWQYEDNIGGFVTEYIDKLSVLTVKGAGHFIARTQPKQLYQLVLVFVYGRPF